MNYVLQINKLRKTQVTRFRQKVLERESIDVFQKDNLNSLKANKWSVFIVECEILKKKP